MQYYDSITPEQLLNNLNNQQLEDQVNAQLNLTEYNDFIQKRVRMRIPQNYHQEPIISSGKIWFKSKHFGSYIRGK